MDEEWYNIVVFGLPSEVRPVRIEISNSNSFPFVLRAIAFALVSRFVFSDRTLHVFVLRSAVGRWWAVGRARPSGVPVYVYAVCTSELAFTMLEDCVIGQCTEFSAQRRGRRPRSRPRGSTQIQVVRVGFGPFIESFDA